MLDVLNGPVRTSKSGQRSFCLHCCQRFLRSGMRPQGTTFCPRNNTILAFSYAHPLSNVVFASYHRTTERSSLLLRQLSASVFPVAKFVLKSTESDIEGWFDGRRVLSRCPTSPAAPPSTVRPKHLASASIGWVPISPQSGLW